MNWLERLLTNHPLVNILFSVVLLMGGLAYVSMPREQDPEINFNWVNIFTALPGATASDVERLITDPLEDAIANVQDVNFVSSNSRQGSSLILVRFREISERVFDKRVNDLRREIQSKANSELPEDIEDPDIIEVTTSSGFPTALVVVTGQANDENLRRQARLIKDDLERLKGINDVVAFGLQDPELHVEFDPQALAARGLTAIDLSDTLRAAFRDVTAGSADVANQQWSVRVAGTTADPDELSALRISSPAMAGRSAALADVARVERGREKPQSLVSLNGQPAVSLSVTKVPYNNTIDLIERLRNYIDQQNALLAGTGLSVVLADDQTVQTREAIGVMQRNAALGLTLVLGVCWLFLGFRISALVTLGIAFSIAGAFWLLDITGNTLNVSVLLGVVIVLGMLVDDAVVVVEAIYYRLQRGATGLQAAVRALREVAQPVTSAVCTTMAAFLPLMLLPGIIGDFMFVIPFVVTMGLLVSLVEAFWILPSHVIGVSNMKFQRGVASPRRTRWTRMVRIKYTKALAWFIRHPVQGLSGAFMAVLLAFGALSAGLVKTDFFAVDPLRVFYVNVDLPPDTRLEETLAMTVQVEQQVVHKYLLPGEARAVTSQAGLKFTQVEVVNGDHYGQIQVSLAPAVAGSRPVNEVVDSMREAARTYPGDARLSFLENLGGPPTTKPISVKIRSDDFEVLRSATRAMRDFVSQLPGARDITDNDVAGSPELVVSYDHAAIQRAGLDPGRVARLVRLHADGEIVAFVRDSGEKVELRVRADPRRYEDVVDILADPVVLDNGQSTSLSSLVSYELTNGRSDIRHFNFRRAITVEAELDRNVNNTLDANNDIKAWWAEVQVQYPGTDLDFTGQLDDLQESLDAMLGLFLLGLGLIYLILATQFRSYFQPLLILVTVPMAFTGVVLGLTITQNPLSLYTLYGVIALTGIAVNSAIVLIDAANARIAAGMRPLHATMYAARRRVIPIIMTTSTTIAGLFSLAIGLGGKSFLWGPIASSIVAGLLVATPLTLFVVPMLYRLFMRGHGLPEAGEGASAKPSRPDGQTAGH